MRDDDRPNAADRPGGPARPPTAPEPWDDERLAAAFAGRYDRPAPRDLTIATLERVAETRRRPRWWPGVDRPTRDRLVPAVAVVAVVAVVGVVMFPRTSSRPGTTATGPAGSGTAPTSGQESPYQSFEPSPSMAGFGAVAVDLPVRSVADVSVILANPGLGDTELAFGGWYSASDLALGCQDQGEPASPIQIRCTDIHAWLSSTDRPILSADGSFEQPANPADLLPLRFVIPMDPPQGEAGAGSWKVATPRSVILIGHFHDERSSRCPADEQATCERTFVVDGIARATGELKDPSMSSTTTTTVAPRLTAVDAMRIAQARIAGYGQILSVGLAQGNDAPWFTAARNADCRCPPTWFVRGYRTVLEGDPDPRGPGTPVAAWMTIDDATGAILGPLTTGVPAPATPFPFAPPPDGFPATIEGMSVRTVADVVDPDRVAEPPDHPIAVAGWFTQLPLHPCEATADCNRETVILAGTDKRLVTTAPGGVATLVPPDGPVLNPAILPGGASRPAVPIGTPVPAIFIVHAGDPRADRDGPGNPVGPETFVLDQVAWLSGKAQGPAEWIAPGLKLVKSPAQVLRDTAGGALTAPGTWPISISAVLTRDLATLGVHSGQDIAWGKVVWVVRLVGQMPRADGPPGPDGYGDVLVVGDEIVETRWTSP